MKPAPFDYVCPSSLEAALQLLGDPDQDSQLLAGGQSLMPMMNLRLARPDRLIDLGKLDELRGVTRHQDGLEIGAMTRYADLAADPQIASHFNLIMMALPHIAHIAIRNRGTLGGSLGLADPAAEMPALMQALNARINCQSQTASRQIEAADFFIDLYETDLQPGEMIRSVFLPFMPAGARFSFDEIARRHGDYADAGLVIAADSPALDNLRLVWFGLESSQRRDRQLEASLTGLSPSDALDRARAMTLDHLEISAAEDIKISYKRQLAKTLLVRGLARLADGS